MICTYYCLADPNRFGDQLLTRIEVLVEATYRKAGFLHQLRYAEPRETLFAELNGKCANCTLSRPRGSPQAGL
jgi:hypothetical protein